MKIHVITVLLLGISGGVTHAQGTILWDESVNGPLANDFTQPTSLGTFQNGTNSIIGASQLIGAGIYGDYFSFTVPNSLEVSALWLSVDKPVAVWLGDQAFANQSAYVIDPANGDVLLQWSLNPVGANTYGMYIKNYDLVSNPSTSNYRLDFFVQVVPEPSAISLLLIVAGIVLLHRRRQPKH